MQMFKKILFLLTSLHLKHSYLLLKITIIILLNIVRVELKHPFNIVTPTNIHLFKTSAILNTAFT
jgi:hypothetical protein